MKKKITALMLALSMLLALTACGESEQVEENTAPAGLAVQVPVDHMFDFVLLKKFRKAGRLAPLVKGRIVHHAHGGLPGRHL